MFDKIMAKNTKEWVPETKEKTHFCEGNGTDTEPRGIISNDADNMVMDFKPEINQQSVAVEACSSIQAIIDTMIDAGCETCASLLVAKMELKKFKGGVK